MWLFAKDCLVGVVAISTVPSSPRATGLWAILGLGIVITTHFFYEQYGTSFIVICLLLYYFLLLGEKATSATSHKLKPLLDSKLD
jgi:hypothetical protein